MKRSAGILPYKFEDDKLKVYLEHPGGPYWNDIDKWGICKGEYTTEKAIDAALREFKEESGFDIIKEELFYVGSYKVSKSKIVTIFAVEKDLDETKMTCNLIKKPWPFNSNNIIEFPEMDKAKWFDIEEAKDKIFDNQVRFLYKLFNIIKKR